LNYFSEVAALGCSVARVGDEIVGFVCGAVRGTHAYYLHGAQNPSAREHHPSDLLFRHMIAQARDAGGTRFDFLPSPAAQPSLVRYKVAWGGEIVRTHAFDVALRPLRARAFRIARAVAERLPMSLLPKLTGTAGRAS
jgi:lipid II:glycine glycyltransferase (peptidoglycan interpeptide bridge formation enzyme)